ncbi:S8 family serine peptidase [Streptomyces sp. NBC_00310]|uniref:S8 family serine peptidase n=1 Tax=Streptomyces sp. NBC_00310 TaxID=2903645 RepID=UPI002E1F1367
MANGPMDRRAFGGQHDRLTGQGAEYTGRYVVLLEPGDQENGLNALRSYADIAFVERVGGIEAATVTAFLERPDVSVLFEELGAAVVEVRPEKRHALVTTAEATSSIIAAEPERIVYASPITVATQAPTEFFPAYRSDEDVVARHTRATTAASQGPAWDEQQWTWGLQVIRTNLSNLSNLTGRDVKIAFLDTGVDTDHPDLAGRIEAAVSFVPGESVEDMHGHGTHCIGTAAGPVNPQQGPRYGVACEARILAAKVLSNAGTGTDGQILAGMAWAVARGARVISMSLGVPVQPGELFPQTYEKLAQRVLALDTVIVAAGGNRSERPGFVAPVDRPANCPSILAVGALDKALTTAFFSNGGINDQWGELNVAAPGWQVHSAAPGGGYQLMSGTSMATAHVAGAVALLAQENPNASAVDLTASLRRYLPWDGNPLPAAAPVMSALAVSLEVPHTPKGSIVPLEVLDLQTGHTIHALAHCGMVTKVDVKEGPLYVQAKLADGQVLTAFADMRGAARVTLKPHSTALEDEQPSMDNAATSSNAFPALEREVAALYSGSWARLWRLAADQKSWTPVPFEPIALVLRSGALQWGMDEAGGCVLQVGGDHIAHRCVLLPPTDQVTVTLTHTGDDELGFNAGYVLQAHSDIERAEALLAYNAAGQLTAAQIIADHYDALAETMLYDKVSSPLGAIVGGYHLLRSRALGQTHEWPKNLADWFPQLPDAAVVRIGQLLQASEPDQDEVRARIHQALDVGLPSYTDGLRWLYRATELLLAVTPEREDVAAAYQHLRPYADAADWDAVLTSFRGDPNEPTVEQHTGPLDDLERTENTVPLVPLRYAS